jgi:hypothetical protein
VAPPQWLTQAEAMANASPAGPLTGLLAQFKQLSEQIHALAMAPPPPAPSIPGADDPNEEEQAAANERGRSRTPPGGPRCTKKQRKNAPKATESDAEEGEEDEDTRDGTKTPQ